MTKMEHNRVKSPLSRLMKAVVDLLKRTRKASARKMRMSATES